MKKVAYIHCSTNGKYHVSDDSADILDERGCGCDTLVGAYRVAHQCGYTHARGFGRKVHRIPARYRQEW